MADKSTVYHPVFRDVTREVADDAARESHKAAGWRMTPIPDGKAEADAPKPKAPAARPVETNAAD